MKIITLKMIIKVTLLMMASVGPIFEHPLLWSPQIMSQPKGEHDQSYLPVTFDYIA